MPSLEFKGKSFIYTHHLSVPFRELVVDAKKSLPLKGQKPSLDDNLIIHGDNLHALKALMPTYAGKVDCIVIDPPYNTGSEGWCYSDNVRSPLMKEWLKDEANPVDKEDLERHDKWLCMMWPRLQLLWELLSNNGSLFVFCDDNEASRLGVLLSEICQEQCFVSCIVWQKVFAKKNKAQISVSHDYIYVFSKQGSNWDRNLIARSDDQLSSFSNPDNDPRGDWQSVSFSVQSEGAQRRDKYRYKIVLPSGREVAPPPGRHWNGLEHRYEQLMKEGRFWYGQDGDSPPRIKVYLTEVQQGIVPDTWWAHENSGNNQEAKKELNEIFSEGDVFPTPKPLRVIQKILEIATNADSLVLDSFAGSGTTAHAVLAANAKDGGNRKFILAEMEDYADTLTAERIRRVINGYAYTGTKREVLHRENITWTKLKKASDIIETVEGIKMMDENRFDRIKPSVKDGELIVVGETDVEKKIEGLSGGFTYAVLGSEMSIDSLLADGLPEFEALARYVFYTATGLTLGDVAKQTTKNAGYIGETDSFRVHLLYKPDKAWLRSNDAALTEELVDKIVATNKGTKKVLVFAAAKFMGQRELTRNGVDFCQLPYAIHRILGD